jgi:hypothetical protein
VINHGRTLLLNRNGADRPEPTFFLEEYVPTDYAPVNLSSALNTIHQVLMGSGADDAYVNFRVWQYLRLIHSTEFMSLLLDLDPRITYVTDRTLIDKEREYSVTPANAAASGMEGSIVGEPQASFSRPRLMYTWEVRESTPDSVIVFDAHTRDENEEAVTFTDGLSSLIPMIGQTDVYIRLQGTSLPNGAIWNVNIRAKTPEDLHSIITPLDALSDELMLSLFGAGSEEPYATLSELWEKHNYFHYRMSGVLLAFIYRVEELRTSAG